MRKGSPVATQQGTESGCPETLEAQCDGRTAQTAGSGLLAQLSYPKVGPEANQWGKKRPVIPFSLHTRSTPRRTGPDF